MGGDGTGDGGAGRLIGCNTPVDGLSRLTLDKFLTRAFCTTFILAIICLVFIAVIVVDVADAIVDVIAMVNFGPAAIVKD